MSAFHLVRCKGKAKDTRMGVTYGLNVCETAEGYLTRFAGDPHAMIAALTAEAGMPSCQRLYVGSNFCVQRFLGIPSWFFTRMGELCATYDMRMTLAVPTPTQATLDLVKGRVSSLIGMAGEALDEITVNDVGMLEYVSRSSDKAINIGRLLNRGHRDPRYLDLREQCVCPEALTFDWEAVRVRYPSVRGIELDPTASVVDVSACPHGLVVGLHVPYCYISTSHICEYAARDKLSQEKFRAEAACASECLECHTHYWDEAGVHFMKVGKTVYYPNNEVALAGADGYRLICTPYEMGC